MAELHDLEHRDSRNRHASRGQPTGTATVRSVIPIRALLPLLAIVTAGVCNLTSINAMVNPEPENRDTISAEFHVCADGEMSNCVIDASNFFFNGEAMVVGDIVAPHATAAACPAEAKLAESGAQKMVRLLNGGAFEMRPDVRPTDEAGRKLRILNRDGVSLGQLLVGQGMAQPTGSTPNWCAQSPST